MKTQMLFQIAILATLTACQSDDRMNNLLSKEESRKKIMTTISLDPAMHKQMMGVMMAGKNGMELMMENHEAMMKMMKENPSMMKGMMEDMMGASKMDTAMKASMCKTMMSDPKMMEMMEKMKTDKMDMSKMDMSKMKEMDTKKPIDHSAHH
jgi:hypothetical protein